MPNAQRQPREVLDFPPNIPVTVALKYNQGRTCSNQYGERMMFTTCDNRVMFCDLDVAEQITALRVNVREPFTITMRDDGKKGSEVTWQVARIAATPPAVGEQGNGTFAVPKLPETAAAPKPPGRATFSTQLVAEASALVDAYAEVLAHALTKHEGRVKPDEVRALLITSYIQRNKLSSVA